MKYTKPEIRSFGLASVAIQSDTMKDHHIVLDFQKELATNAAYEADE